MHGSVQLQLRTAASEPRATLKLADSRRIAEHKLDDRALESETLRTLGEMSAYPHTQGTRAPREHVVHVRPAPLRSVIHLARRALMRTALVIDTHRHVEQHELAATGTNGAGQSCRDNLLISGRKGPA